MGFREVYDYVPGKAAWLGMGFKLVFAESIDKLRDNFVEVNPHELGNQLP